MRTSLWKIVLGLLLAFLLHPAPAMAQEEESLDMEEYLFGHISDAYEWHLFTVKGKEIAIPLPCIIIDKGVHIFSAEHLAHGGEHDGYKIAAKGEKTFPSQRTSSG